MIFKNRQYFRFSALFDDQYEEKVSIYLKKNYRPEFKMKINKKLPAVGGE